MKKLTFKSLLLLCALIVGTGYVWGANSYSLVTNVSQLAQGDVILITSGTSGTVYAMGTYSSGNNVPAKSVSVSNGVITSIGDAQEITIETKNASGYTLKQAANNYFYAANSSSGSKNYLKTKDDNAVYWSITINTTTSVAAITDVTSDCNSRNCLKYNYNNGSPLFSCYSSADDNLFVFKKDYKPEPPSFDVPGGEFGAAFTLTITSETESNLKYTTDGTAPGSSGTATSVASNSTTVSIPAATTRVRAIAIKNGKSSDEKDVTYTYSSKEEPTFTLSPSSLALKVGVSGTLTLTTNSDGEVTFACEDAHVTITGSGKTRTISADAEGDYTVNVSVAASSTYMAKAGSVTVNVTKYATTVSIDASSIAGTDLYNLNEAGSLSASVTYGDPASAVPESSVTWTSSDKSIATVGYSTGVVNILKAGSTTITASYAGTATYASSSKTYVLTVTDTRNTPFSWNLATNSYDATPTTGLISWSNARAIMKNERTGEETAVNNYIPTAKSSTRFYEDNKLTISPIDGYKINSVEFTATTDGYASALSGSTWTNAEASAYEKLAVVRPTNGKSAISASIGGTCGFTLVKVYYEPIVTIGETGWATYTSSDAIDFSTSGISAYIVTGVTSGTITKSVALSDVPANTPLLINGDADDYVLKIAASSSTSTDGNILVRGTGVAMGTNADHYVLVKSGEKAVFQSLEEHGATVGVNKAYLNLGGSGAPSIIRIEDEENNATTIENIEANEKVVKYIENGQLLFLRGGITYDALGRIIK